MNKAVLLRFDSRRNLILNAVSDTFYKGKL